jgi:hypothetical protein
MASRSAHAALDALRSATGFRLAPIDQRGADHSVYAVVPSPPHFVRLADCLTREDAETVLALAEALRERLRDAAPVQAAGRPGPGPDARDEEMVRLGLDAAAAVVDEEAESFRRKEWAMVAEVLSLVGRKRIRTLEASGILRTGPHRGGPPAEEGGRECSP